MPQTTRTAPLRRLALAVLLASAALTGTPASAHHAFEVHYELDPEARVSMQGVLRRFSPRSPHSFVVVAVDDGDRVTDWVLEAPSRALLARAGWPFERLVEGLAVEFTGFPARNGEPAMRLQHLTLPDTTLCGYYCDAD